MGKRSEDILKIGSGSDAWVSQLQPYIAARILELHLELETPGFEPEANRGAIAELRRLARIIAPDAPMPGTSTNYFPSPAGSSEPS